MKVESLSGERPDQNTSFVELDRPPNPKTHIKSRKVADQLRALLMAFDVLAVVCLVLISRKWLGAYVPWSTAHLLEWTLVGVFGAITMFWLFGLYDLSNVSAGSGEYGRLFGAASAWVLVDLYCQTFLGHESKSSQFLNFWLMALVVFSVDRFLTRRITFLLRRYRVFRRRTLLLGASGESLALVRHFVEVPSTGVDVVGIIDDSLAVGTEPVPNVKVLGCGADLERILSEQSIETVLIAEPSYFRDLLEHHDKVLDVIREVEVQVTTGVSDLFTASARIHEEGLVPVVSLDKRRVIGVHWILKTLLDYVVTGVGVILISPILFALYLGIKLTSPGPAIYKHRRIGMNRKDFYALKFRSMYIDGDSRLTPEQREELSRTMKLRDDPRITKIGAFMRRTSLDELPQLFNVLAGQMSLVGPRPVVESELEMFGKWQHARLTVKPGLTGLWQVSGRSDLSYEDRVRLDHWYVRNYTIWLDLQILFKTIPAVLFSRGAY